tara:strand:+ start:296 stop:550 length:255 start_codon:yes stop_codon:yes gene_type:complete
VEEEYKNAGKFSRSDNVTGIKSSTEIEKFLFSATQNLARREQWPTRQVTLFIQASLWFCEAGFKQRHRVESYTQAKKEEKGVKS